MTERTRIARLKRWVAALRSGDYKQGRGRLVDYKNCYCCLGVAAKLAKLSPDSESDSTSDDPAIGYRPIREHYGLTLLRQNQLTDINDGTGMIGAVGEKKRSFKFIATWIEKNLIANPEKS
jgi:hypothetical protein